MSEILTKVLAVIFIFCGGLALAMGLLKFSHRRLEDGSRTPIARWLSNLSRGIAFICWGCIPFIEVPLGKEAPRTLAGLILGLAGAVLLCCTAVMDIGQYCRERKKKAET